MDNFSRWYVQTKAINIYFYKGLSIFIFSINQNAAHTWSNTYLYVYAHEICPQPLVAEYGNGTFERFL